MDEIDDLSHLVRAAVDGTPWHGPSMRSALEGVDVASAAAHPIEGAHSIWEIALHLTGWTREVARRLEGNEPRPPELGDWPETGPLDPERWEAAHAGLLSSHEDLLVALRRFPARNLPERVGAERDAPLGTGVSYREMILGALQHDAYHAGQIALLKKAFHVHHR
jgi:hypothetical protein